MPFLPVALLLLLASSPALGLEPAGDEGRPHWPGWRGPTRDGISTETGLPVRFRAGETGLWKVEVPGRGHSSPIVWGDRLFLSAAITGDPVPGHAPPTHFRDGEVYLHPGSEAGELSHTLLALAFDRETGRELWRRAVHEGPVYDNRHRSNTYASPTPLTDGQRVYFFFGSEGLFAFTLDGDPLWEADLGDFGVWGLGHGISPIRHGEALILVCDDDAGEGSVVAAVDRRTGELLWRTPRRVRKSWATPAVVPVAGAEQVVVPSYDRITAYDPASGAELWRLPGFDSNLVHTPVLLPAPGGPLVFVSTGYPKKEMRALRVFASEPPETVWRHERGTGYLPSALLYEGVLFVLSDGGVVTALDPESGALLFRGRPSRPGRFHASPIGYEGQVLISSLEGDLTVIRAGREFEIVAESSLPEAIWASPAVAGGTIFLRGVDHLHAFREPARGRPTEP